MNKVLSLHNELEKIAPIAGVAELKDGTHRIDFKPSATETEIADANAFVATWSPPADPDWAAFRTDLYQNPAWQRVLNTNAAIGSSIITALWRIENEPALFAEIKSMWDSSVSSLSTPLSSDEIAALNAIATTNNTPFSLLSVR
ncbi:MAG: hypothetical protein AAGA75_20560 [Cyanobacteria bacterium P01_E01_bin.6]